MSGALTDTELEIPIADGESYMPYQMDGIRMAKDNRRVLLADEQGLGKTIQGIGVLNSHPRYRRVLIICPASVCQNWEAEIHKFASRSWTIGIPRGQEWPDTEIVIIPWTSIWRGAYPVMLQSQPWDLLIVDEAHNLRNEKTKAGEILYGRKKNARKGIRHAIPGLWARQVILMTGTPIVNKPMELWPLAHYVWPEMFSDWHAFVTRYCGAKRIAGRWETTGSTNAEELNALLQKCGMIRRLKKDVMKDLPPKTRQVIPLEPSEEVARVLNREQMEFQLHQSTIDSLAAKRELALVLDDEDAFRALGKELASTTLAAFSEMAKVRQEVGLLKIPWAVEQAKAILEGRDKLIIFCVHHAVADAIEASLTKDGFKCVKYTGNTPVMKRHAMVQHFQDTESGVRVFIGNIQAAGTGITLTASQNVMFAEESWVPGEMNQATDRAHRYGQRGNVHITHMIFKGSLDAHMMKTWIEKQEIIDSILDPEQGMNPEDAPEEIPRHSYERKEQIAWIQVGEAMTILQRQAVVEGIRFMATLDKDGATARNGCGYSKYDSEIGASLHREVMRKGSLTPSQSALAAKVLKKYHRQLPDHISGALEDFNPTKHQHEPS